MKITAIVLLVEICIVSCTTPTVKIVNEKEGKLKATRQLVNIAEKKFPLDTSTAPKPQYIQLYTDSSGKINLTLLNTYNHSIYFYDYNTATVLDKIAYEKEGSNGIRFPMAYYIKNLDSIYVFDRMKHELVLTNSQGQVFSHISLINNLNVRNTTWVYLYPQYYPYTATPILETKNKLLFTGQYMFSIPQAIIDTFRFTANVGLNDNTVTHTHRYPHSLFGYDYNWGEGWFTAVYAELSPKEGEIIYSFPISHDLFIADINKEGYRPVYAGSNEAGTISSIGKNLKKKEHISKEDFFLKVCQTDLYAAIKYDKYLNVYYRFLRKAIPHATRETKYTDKPVAVIIYDDNFNYLGETTLGKWKNYYWENAFVTEEGLNIEYVDDNDTKEQFLTFKIFALQKK